MCCLTKRLQLDKTIRAISNAQRSLESKKQPDGKLFQFIVQEFEMQKNTEWKGKYFGAEARAKVAARRGQLTSEELEKAHTAWAEFHGDVQASLREDPAGPNAQRLWLALNG